MVKKSASVVEKDCKANRHTLIFNEKVSITCVKFFFNAPLGLVNKYDYVFVAYRLDKQNHIFTNSA